VVRTPPQRKAHVDSAREIAKHLLFQGMQVSLRGICMGGAKYTQRRGNIGTRADCRVLKVAEEAEVEILSHLVKGRGVHVCEAG
jgi:hypothetical protein